MLKINFYFKKAASDPRNTPQTNNLAQNRFN